MRVYVGLPRAVGGREGAEVRMTARVGAAKTCCEPFIDLRRCEGG